MKSLGNWSRTVLESPFDVRVGLSVVRITVFCIFTVVQTYIVFRPLNVIRYSTHPASWYRSTYFICYSFCNDGNAVI